MRVRVYDLHLPEADKKQVASTPIVRGSTPLLSCTIRHGNNVTRHRVASTIRHIHPQRFAPIPFVILLHRTGLVWNAVDMFSRRRKSNSRCTSAGRVTAKLLLSFLALSASPVASAGSSRQDAQLVLPIEAAPIPPLILEPPKPAEQTFVSGILSCLSFFLLR
jgi:hypothetical protein